MLRNELKGANGNLGFSLIGVVIGLTIVTTVGYYTVSSLTQSNRLLTIYKYELVGLGYISELAELFRSLESGTRLRQYFTTRNWDTKFCEEQNQLDRATGAIANPNPLAVMPVTPLDFAGGNSRASRSFSISVIDVISMTAVDYCGLRVRDVPPPSFDDARYRYAIRVSLDFIPPGVPVNKNLFLTVVLPDA